MASPRDGGGSAQIFDNPDGAAQRVVSDGLTNSAANRQGNQGGQDPGNTKGSDNGLGYN
ncbi:hypothetical protein OAT84_00665 [Gammaproteobacteria bacterium]|nr:hypothetical protein [Gammaproteobacteria bacterium]